MVPYPIFQCLLLSYISGQATAGFFPALLRSGSFGMKSFKFNMKPIKFEMKPLKFEMKPLKFDSTLLKRDMKLNFNDDAFKPLLKNENGMSGYSSPQWRKKIMSEIQETNFRSDYDKVLPLMSDQQLVLYNRITKILAGKKKAGISPKGKNDSPSRIDIHSEGSAGKAKESNLDSLKNSDKDLSHKNGQELDPSETNRKNFKVETPDKHNNPHVHIHAPESSEKTNESFSMSFKQNGGHLPFKNNQELDLSKTSVKGLKEEKPEKVKNGHIPHQESSDDDNSKKIQNLKHKNNLFLALNQNPDAVAGGSFQQGSVMIFLIIFIAIGIILFICFKKYKKIAAKKQTATIG